MTDPQPLDVLRLLLDPVRLSVAGAAVSRDIPMAELAERLDVSPKTVARAVGDLRSLGLLDAAGRIDPEVLRGVAVTLPAAGPTSEPVAGPWTEEESAILGRFFDGERLVQIPSSHRKRRLVLEKIALAFEPGRRYRERDVNFMIQLIHPDYATVRRYLIDEALLERADGAYWRIGGRVDVGAHRPTGPAADRTVIETTIEGVELRAYERPMVPALAEAANVEQIHRFMSDEFPFPYTIEDAEGWLDMATGSPPTQYAVFVDGQLVGGIGGFPGKAEDTGSWEIGWWLHPDHWGRGITSAAARAIVDEFFGVRDAMRLYAPVMVPNTASARVAEHAGLRLEGVERSFYLKEGVRYDKLMYGITRKDWLAGR